MRAVGVLLSDGVSRGNTPSLQVFAIGPAHIARKPNDLLPCLPAFRPFFSPLPKHKSEMELRATTVALSDVECVTQSQVKVRFNLLPCSQLLMMYVVRHIRPSPKARRSSIHRP